MVERDFKTEFFKIMDANFPEHANDRVLGDRVQIETEVTQSESASDDERWERIMAAASDERIADYYFDGHIDEVFLTVQLQQDYTLTEEEAQQAIHRGTSDLSQIVGYGDEA